MRQFLTQGITTAIFSLLLGPFAFASEEASEPASFEFAYEVVEDVTQKLLTVAKSGKEQLETDPVAYYESVGALLDPAVNFEFIAKNVMGKKYWLSVSPEQQQLFVSKFRGGLVETYAKGMASFTDLKIEVEKPETPAKSGRQNVIQTITGPEGANKVAYTMRKNKEGNWQLINVVLNGINLGRTFRSQFAQSVKESRGDVGAAIASWGASE